MEHVIEKLSEIEEAAQNLIENASHRKKEIADEIAEQTRLFDERVDEETNQSLASVRGKLDEQVQQELNLLKEKTEKIIQEMDQDYEDNHSQIAANILKKLIEV